MAKQSRASKNFNKFLSVFLCVALLGVTYAGFFAGFGAAAGALDTLEPGEVGLNKSVTQTGRSAAVTVKTAAVPFTEEIVETSSVKQNLDVVIIIDTSGSMNDKTEKTTVMASVKTAAKELASNIYKLNPENRVALGSFAQYAYVYAPNKSGTIQLSAMSNSNSYFFTSAQANTLNSRISALSANGGTNSEGGLMAAEAILDTAKNDGRNKLVVFMTDGLPTGRYKDNGTKLNSIATYDGSGNGIPNYQELSEMLEVADRIADREGTQLSTVFFTGGLTDTYSSSTSGMNRNQGYVSYYPGCTKSSCNCHSASGNHGTINIVAPDKAVTAEEKLMSGFYHKYNLGSASYIVNDLLATKCEAGVYMPNNASAMLQAFKDIVSSYTKKNLYAPATGAKYDDIIPDYAVVDEASINVTAGKASVLKAQSVEINGKIVQRDILRWTIGTIPEQAQTLSYNLLIKDDRTYGIVDAAEQGILTYNEVAGCTKTHSPLIAQIDELILAPKGQDDYYTAIQDKVLRSNVLTNDDALNNLIDTSGDAYDAAKLVNGQIAGLNGKQSAAGLNGYTVEVIDAPAWGDVAMNADGSFSYTQKAAIFDSAVKELPNDTNAPDSYNAITAGWEDSFTYVLKTTGTPTAPAVAETASNGSADSRRLTFTGSAATQNDKINVLVFENMQQNGADSEGRTIIGGNLTVNNGFSASQVDIYNDQYALMVGGNVNVNGILNVSLKAAGYGDHSGDAIMVSGESWINDYVNSARSYYTGLSQHYAQLAPSGTAERNQGWTAGVTLNADPNHVAGTPHVFNIDGSLEIAQLIFAGNFGDDAIIINVSGKNPVVRNGSLDKTSGCNLTVPQIAQRTVWNFYEAETITSSGISYEGSILAPNASFSYENGHINGSVIVRELIGVSGAQYNTGYQLYGVNCYMNESTGYVGDTASTGSAHTEPRALTDYRVSANANVNAEQALESEKITVRIRIKPDLSSLSAVKEANPQTGATVKSGDEITYTITVNNPRTVPAENVVITDVIPTGTTVVDFGGAQQGEDGKLVWNVNIPARDKTAVSFKVKVDDVIFGKNNLGNVAYVEFATPGEEETTTVTTNPVGHAYISAKKSSSAAADTVLAAGDNVDYTITVTNNGSADATGVLVTDNLPQGLTFTGGQGAEIKDGVVTATIDRIAAGESVDVTFTAVVDSFDIGVRTYQNTAEVNGIATNTVTNTAKRGSVTRYFKEKGTSTELAESVTETGRTGDSYGPYDEAAITNYRLVDVEGSRSGIYTDGAVAVTFLYEKIPGFATVYYINEDGNAIAEPKPVSGYQGDTLETLYGKEDTIGNYGYVTTNAAGYTLTESGIEITHVYKLKVDKTLPSIAKTAEPADGTLVRSGDTITYTITVTNEKYEDMTNVAVVDTLPKGTTLVDANGAAQDGDRLTFTIPVIAVGETAQVSFTAAVNAELSGEGNLSNTAMVIYTDREDTTATELSTNTVSHAVLTYNKASGTNLNGFYGVGDSINYFISVKNVGSAKTNVIVDDPIPAGTTLATGSNTAEFELAPGASKPVEFSVIINDIEGYEAAISNTAYVNGQPTNTTTDTVKKAYVSVSFVDEQGNALIDSKYYSGTPGQPHGSTEPAVIPGYTLKETQGTTDGRFAADTTIEIVNIYERTPAHATIMYVNKDTSTELLPRVIVNGFVGDTVEEVQKAEITNYLFVETNLDEGTTLTDDGITIIHYYGFIKPDDSVPEFTKTATPEDGTAVHEGDLVTYTITFKNTRIDPINNLVISDFVPMGAELYGEEAVADENGKLAWSVESLEPGQTAKVSFTVKVKSDLSGKGNLANTATASFENRDLESEESIATNTVGFPIIKGALDHYNDQPDAVLTHEDTIFYEITVNNVGSESAYDVPVTALIPEGTTFASSNDMALVSGIPTANLAKLLPGQTVVLKYSVTIDRFADNVFTKELTNTATVNGVNTNSVVDTPKTGAVVVNHYDYDNSVKKTESLYGQRVGTSYGTYSDLVTLKELADRKLTGVDADTFGKYTEGVKTINFTYERIPAALTVRYVETGTEPVVELKVPEVAEDFWQGDSIPDSYTEPVAIDGYNYDYVAAPEGMKFDTAAKTITHYYTRILDTDKPIVEKTSVPANGAEVKAGQEIEYTITVNNPRATDALEQTIVTDAVPKGTTYIENSASNGGQYDEETGIVTWNIGAIPAGETVSVKFAVRVNSDIESKGNLANVADCTYTDIQTGNTVTVPTNAIAHALIVTNKTSSVSEDVVLTDGSRVVYTVTATNIGSAAAPVVITDRVPEGTLIELSKLPENVTYSEGVLTVSVEALEAGETATLSFEAMVNMAGRYRIEFANTAEVNGEKTNTVVNRAERGQVVVSYELAAPDGTRTALVGGETVTGAVGDAVVLSDINSYENLRYAGTETSDEDVSAFIAGEMRIVHVFERIPGTATILYKDIETKAELLASKTIPAYVGDKLNETYRENVKHYRYISCEAPAELTVTENGLTVTHWYEEIPDITELERDIYSVPESGSITKPGEQITYYIEVTNPRREPISNVAVTTDVPAGAELVNAEGAEVNGNQLTWTIDILEPKQTEVVSFTVTVNDNLTEGGNLYVDAEVTYTNRKENTPTTLKTGSIEHSVLFFSKAVDKTEVKALGELTYTISVANYGAATAENIVVTDEIPAGTELMTGANAANDNGVLTYTIAKLAAGETAELSFTVKCGQPEDGTYRMTVTNTAKVNGDDTNTVESIVTMGEVIVAYVDGDGKALKTSEKSIGGVGETHAFDAVEIEGYDFVSVEGEPEGTFIEGSKNVTFIYKKGEGVVTINYLEEGTNLALADSVTYKAELGTGVKSLYRQSIPTYQHTRTEIPDSIEITRDGVEINHFYKKAYETYTITGKVWETNNPDSSFGDDDRGLEGIIVILEDNQEAEVQRDTTDNEGEYTFEDVPVGDYHLAFEVPDGFAVADEDDYDVEKLRSVVDSMGKTSLSVEGDTPNVGVELVTKVLGASDEIDESATEQPEATETYEPLGISSGAAPELVKVYQKPEVVSKEEAIYTKVLGDNDSAPKTGDDDFGKIIAVVIASISLFVLILCKKHS